MNMIKAGMMTIKAGQLRQAIETTIPRMLNNVDKTD